MGVAENVLDKGYLSQPPVLMVSIGFFSVITVLLTFPLLLTPDRIHLTAPPAYSFLHEEYWYLQHPTKGQEYIDHLGAMAGIDGAVRRLFNGGTPILVDPNYAVPPSYVLLGILVTIVFPVSTIVFHNLFFTLSVFLAGFFTFLLVREVLDDVEVSLLAGALYMSSFYIFNTYVMGHTNQWQIQWIPLILFGVERMHSRSETGILGKSTVLLGVAFALQVLSSLQYSAYLGFMLPLYILLRTIYGAVEYRSLSCWKDYGISTIIAVILTSPYLYARIRLLQSGATESSPLEADMYNWYYLRNVIGEFFVADAQLQFVFRVLLITGGLVTLFTVSRQRFRQLVPFAFLFGIGVMIAWGPFSPWAPYSLLHRYWPLIEYFRVPYRMLPFALLGSSTLSATVLLHLPDKENGWAWQRITTIGVILTIQISIVHYSLVFTEYMR